VKDFLHNPKESGALSFAEAEANAFVQASLRRYLTIVLPDHQCRYSPVPASGNFTLETTVQAMAKSLNRKNLLEFALTVLPEEQWLHHLMIFETSVYPPLMAQREHWPWGESLFHVSYQYFAYSCQQGLTVAVTNLLTIASILILSWPTSLRYGPLALAINSSSGISVPCASAERLKPIIEALQMVQAFSDKEKSLVWECHHHNITPTRQSKAQVPSRKQLADVVAGFEVSHAQIKDKGKDSNPGHQWEISNLMEGTSLGLPPLDPRQCLHRSLQVSPTAEWPLILNTRFSSDGIRVAK
jgi:hypothetical protein